MCYNYQNREASLPGEVNIMRYSRQNKILEIISNNEIETQEKLAAMLKSEGFDVTQRATANQGTVINRQV